MLSYNWSVALVSIDSCRVVVNVESLSSHWGVVHFVFSEICYVLTMSLLGLVVLERSFTHHFLQFIQSHRLYRKVDSSMSGRRRRSNHVGCLDTLCRRMSYCCDGQPDQDQGCAPRGGGSQVDPIEGDAVASTGVDVTFVFGRHDHCVVVRKYYTREESHQVSSRVVVHVETTSLIIEQMGERYCSCPSWSLDHLWKKPKFQLDCTRAVNGDVLCCCSVPFRSSLNGGTICNCRPRIFNSRTRS